MVSIFWWCSHRSEPRIGCLTNTCGDFRQSKRAEDGEMHQSEWWGERSSLDGGPIRRLHKGIPWIYCMTANNLVRISFHLRMTTKKNHEIGSFPILRTSEIKH